MSLLPLEFVGFAPLLFLCSSAQNIAIFFMGHAAETRLFFHSLPFFNDHILPVMKRSKHFYSFIPPS